MLNSEVPKLRWLHFSFALLIIGIFWLLVDLFSYIDWNKGERKATLILAIALAAAVIILDGQHLKAGDQRSRKLSVWRIAVPGIGGLVLYHIAVESEIALTIQAAVIALMSVAPLAVTSLGIRIDPGERRLVMWATALLVVALLYRFLSFLYYLNAPNLIDIAQTTWEASKAVLEGKNPYSIPVDLNPDYPEYYGYKYLPLMFVTYMPLASAMGADGIRLTNLVLDVITAGLIGLLARQQFGLRCGVSAALLYLMLPMLPRDLYMNGVTDLAPIVPLLIAIALYETRPGLAGIMMGLSVSAKILPGLLFFVCWLPQIGRSRYVGGFLLGLIPAIAFFLLAPADFMRNVVWFVARRPTDTTSWLYGAPSEIISSARLAFVIVVVLVFYAVIWRSPNFLTRCGLNVICIAAALLAGPTVHNNYMLWWIPLFCILLSVTLSGILGAPDVIFSGPVLVAKETVERP